MKIMFKNKDIICISSIDWDFIWQGHQEIMSTFAKNGNRVLFIENTGVRTPGFRDISRMKKRVSNWLKGVHGFRQETENLYVYSPVIFPFPYSRIARWINRRMFIRPIKNWIKMADFHDPVVWAFLPTSITLELLENLNYKLVIYYCIDSFSASSSLAKKVVKTEIKLIKKADLVFVTSHFLYDYCSKYNNKTHIFPFGVNIDNFEKARNQDSEMPAELCSIKVPIIGYIGGVHKWIDKKLIRFIAEAHSDYSFVFIGPLQIDISSLADLKNVYFLGNQKHEQLPYLIKFFDACIIPYQLNDYTRNVYPTKLNEYLIMGKPVISTNLPEINYFNQKYGNIVYIANNPKEFIQCIETAIKKNTVLLQEKYYAVAKQNNWSDRIQQMSILVCKSLEEKAHEKEVNWIKNLLFYYHSARKRFMHLTTTLALVYLLIFYTPLVWFLAAPLKISRPPQRADAIVVFAGGVGESGKAGQGYEERVQYAVELYKKGLARYVIFSSGYAYVFKEPLVMKALAVSLGIPADTIILEDKSKNTYENVKFSSQILTKNNWKKVLLISSPYHMLRASLVINKIAPEIDAIYASPTENLFYRHGISPKGERIWKQINLEQIKSLMHEYLGIIYYWFKGYI